MTANDAAELIVRAAMVRTMAPDAGLTTALAIRDGTITAAAGPDGERELLRAWRGPDTVMLDDAGLVVMPAFVDTHNHLMLAARDAVAVPVSQARDIPRIVDLVRERAQRTPAGQWIITAAGWHEMQLAERRLPTAQELDQATSDHPVLLLRGGHNAVLNTAGLEAAGIGPDFADVAGGFIARDAAGHPSGWVQDAALDVVRAVVPSMSEKELVKGLEVASRRYASHGLGTVRDAMVTPQEWQAYLRARAEGRLSVRSNVMIGSPAAAIRAAGSVGGYIDSLEAQGIRPGAGDERLRLWGLKFLLDGGVEAGALERPYADRPGYRGELLWDREDLVRAFATCVRRGWPAGTHAFGDRAVAVVLGTRSAADGLRRQVARVPSRDARSRARRPDLR